MVSIVKIIHILCFGEIFQVNLFIFILEFVHPRIFMKTLGKKLQKNNKPEIFF